MEPDYSISNLLIATVPFICYYIGIVIRRVVFPGKNAPPLSHQLLLGIPVSLVVVSPLIPIIDASMTNATSLCVTLGIIMEHGMLLNETATKHLRKLRAG